MKSVEFKLSVPVNYQNTKNGGAPEQADCFLMYAPSVKQLSLSTPLKQGLVSQFVKLAKQEEARNNIEKLVDDKPDDKSKASGKQFLIILYSSDINMHEYMQKFRKLCEAGCVQLENGEPITSLIIDSMQSEDFENLMGEYLANFIIGSLFQKQKTI